jgi:hypothetical protein
MSEHDDTLVTSKAGTVVAENLKLSLATASGSITPSTVTAMVGINQGSALQLSPDVTSAMSKLSSVSALDPNYAAAQTALTNLKTLQGKMGFPYGGTQNAPAFGSMLNQAQAHINDSNELKNATNFISGSNFSDFGSGITNMSSMTTQGLNGSFGSLPSAATVMGKTGSCFDLKDMSNFGTGTGLVNSLKNNKLANFSGVNQALTANQVDINDLNDPVYSESITKVLTNIKDPGIISKVKTQFGVSPPGDIASLNDFTDITKLTTASERSGLSTNLAGIGTKFGDLGAKFSSPSAASTMLNNISVPSIPNLESAAPSLSTLMSGHSSVLKSMTGESLATLANPNNGVNGLPGITDFAQHVAGGPAITNFNTSSISASTIAQLEASTAKATSLWSTAGVDLTTQPPNSLGTSMNFATQLHKYGNDSTMTSLLGNMTQSNQYGDAIKASLAEGKNKALMAANGIKPLNFSGS